MRLVALDIDGTLVGDDLNIGPDTRAAIRAARRRGVMVSLITGRMVSSALGSRGSSSSTRRSSATRAR